MKAKFTIYWLLVLVPLLFIIWYFNHKNAEKPNHLLPYYGPKNKLKTNDTLYHQVPAFSFIDQDARSIDTNVVHDKIYVSEFFFTTCHSICPIMNSNMIRVYETFAKESDVLILSHTVDPETDSVPVLKEYALAHGVKDKRWLFLTGAKPQLYELARKGYLLDASEGNGDVDDFVHTQNFALVDKGRHIRGFYDGTDSIEVNRLIKDIKLLQEEYAYNARH